MKEDYLWEKTGSDSEIEDLENTLKSFRSTNTTAPKLPQKTFAFDKTALQDEKPRKFSFQFAFAAFACLALIVLSVGIFQALNINDQNLAQNNSKEMSDETNIEKLFISEQKAVEKTKNLGKEIIQTKIKKAKFTPKPKAKKRVVKVKNQIRSEVKSKKFIAIRTNPKAVEPKVRTVKLTKEEKDAYDQLMRALAITGSQMRIVQEKINGVEEIQTAKKDGK